MFGSTVVQQLLFHKLRNLYMVRYYHLARQRQSLEWLVLSHAPRLTRMPAKVRLSHCWSVYSAIQAPLSVGKVERSQSLKQRQGATA